MNDKKNKGIYGSTLKIIAIAAMLIDHIGAAILERILSFLQNSQSYYSVNYKGVLMADDILRIIGRMGFPLFCFLLVEGFHYTRNKGKYAVRLGLFAIISEIPFDLAFHGKVVELSYQNVFFTLLAGLVVLIGFEQVEKRAVHKIINIVLHILILYTGVIFAGLLRTDYGVWGVGVIAIMYLMRRHKMLEMFSGCLVLSVMSLIEVSAFLTLIPVKLYNGERGLKLKYFFYCFYPIHLLLLYFTAVLLGYGNVVM